jgi:hypothetical protein
LEEEARLEEEIFEGTENGTRRLRTKDLEKKEGTTRIWR